MFSGLSAQTYTNVSKLSSGTWHEISIPKDGIYKLDYNFINSNLKDVNVLIWAGSNFGACDLPVDVERAGVDLIIHFGHSPWLS